MTLLQRSVKSRRSVCNGVRQYRCASACPALLPRGAGWPRHKAEGARLEARGWRRKVGGRQARAWSRSLTLVMNQDKVVRLDISAAQPCHGHEKTWNEVLLELHSAPVQIIFGSVKSFLETPPEVQAKLKQKLEIPGLFLDRMSLQSNGFSGYEVSLGQNERVESYTLWSRFTVKQTYDTLKPKRTFTPHVSNHQSGTDGRDAEIIVHGPQSARYGWEWYEMGFIACWNPSGLVTLVCFDVPERMQSNFQSLFDANTVDTSSPHAVFSLVSDALLRVYDDSVWSLRNHISQWEARRAQETDYFLLHEIARHGVHVSETLRVAIQSLDAIMQHHEKFRMNVSLSHGKNQHSCWDKVESRLAFQLRFLQGLLERSEANNARIQNEITLAFNTAAQADSKIQVRIGEEAKSEASAMKAIAVVTMAFLPATFVSVSHPSKPERCMFW
ncbi:unnamed protein product [Periconia digitata]|uniref:Uncharacterized protein n=1 Tax=Periconia digitata TaxID=1303443 RepID=A0A9W4UU25_9PLEO|nr:unnamed protein product [Periconia digitata]